jgi:hypothetical protein
MQFLRAAFHAMALRKKCSKRVYRETLLAMPKIIASQFA